MKLPQAVNQYVSHKRSLGMQCQTMARQLRAFCQAIGDINVDEIRAEAASAFIYGSGPVTSNLHGKFHVLRGFYRYLLSRGYVTNSPLPTQIPKEPERLIPYIYSREELQRVLQAARKESHWCKLEAHTLQALLLLLYGAGLRISEALRLTLADVDLEQRLLTIRETKFYKTRLVPLGPDLTQVLLTYLAFRCEQGHPSPPEAFLLVTRHSLPVSVQLAEDTSSVYAERLVCAARMKAGSCPDCMTCATPLPCTDSRPVTAKGKMSNDCCHNFRLISGTWISIPRNAISL
jgi:integrase/recombinase XerD